MNGDLVLKSARGQTPHIFIAAPLPVTLSQPTGQGVF